MLTSASVLTPSAAMPQPIDGPAASETPASGAADFLALLGGAKASKKANAARVPVTKPSSLPGATSAAAVKSDSATAADILSASGEAGKAVVAAKAAAKAAAGEAKAEAKAQLGAEISSAILAALGAFGKGNAASGASKPADSAVAPPNAAPVADETGKTKPKALRSAARRDGTETAKPEAGGKSADASQPDAKPVKTEAERIAPVTPRPTESAQPLLVATQDDAGAQPTALPVETQLSEARIPLAAREAAQTGIAAPILAMRVTTKDGVAKSIEIRLDPAELGQVDVKLETGHDGKLHAVLSTESADAFELLKKDSSALENALREAGVDLADGAVTFALNDPGADQSFQREAAYGGANARQETSSENLIAAAAAETSSWRHGVLDISV